MKLVQLLESDISLFMRGGCYALAAYLHAKTGLPLFGLFDRWGDMHHAFVVDPSTDLGYDARGAVALSEMHVFRGKISAGAEIRPTRLDEVEKFRAQAEHRTGRISPSRLRRFVRSQRDLSALTGQTVA